MSRPVPRPGRRTVMYVTTSETPARDTGYLPPMLNPFEPGFFDNPYAQYQLVREQDPVHLSPIGSWALFRYEDVHRVLRDPHLSVEERNATPLPFEMDADIQAMMEERRRGRHPHHAEHGPARPSSSAPAGLESVHAARDRRAPPPRAAARRRAP